MKGGRKCGSRGGGKGGKRRKADSGGWPWQKSKRIFAQCKHNEFGEMQIIRNGNHY